MPRKIKVVWVLCCIAIFFGFIYFSMMNQMRDSRKKKQEVAEQTKQRTEDKIKRQEGKAQFIEMMGQVQELNALGKYKEAAELASRAVVLSPRNAKGYTWWGWSLVKSGNIKDALDKFSLSSQLDPNQPKNYYYWGLALMMDGRNEQAVDKFENALLLDPENSKVYASWGAALNNLKKYDEAIKKLEEALAQNSLNSQAYGVLVDAHFHKGQYQQAWEVVARARKNKAALSKASLKRLSDASPEPR